MTKSMTAYGRHSFSFQKQKFTFEIHSLNRKGLDLSIFLPKEMLFLDTEIRKWVKNIVSRGQVTVKLMKDLSSVDLEACLPKVEELKRFKSKWEEIANCIDLDPRDISLPFLITQIEKLPRSKEDTIAENLEELKSAFTVASDHFLAMKHSEGKELELDILSHMENLERLAKEIKPIVQSESKTYEQRLEQKLEKMRHHFDDMDDRIAREVVIFADKVDVSEELARLDSHFKQFYETLKKDKMSIGKELDFIVLEMNRESNTILAKTSLTEVKTLALGLKSGIEKIREQIQNIE